MYPVMKPTKIILFFMIVEHFMIQSTHEFSLRPKTFKVESVAPCKPETGHCGKLERFDLTQPVKYNFHLDADLRILTDVTETLKLHANYKKCAQEKDGNACDNPESIIFDNVCDRLFDKNAIWSPLLKVVKPKLVCPIKKGFYTVRNGTFDLTIISMIPVNGYRFVTALSIYEHFKNDTPPRQVFCMDSDVIIGLQSSGRSRPSRPRG